MVRFYPDLFTTGEGALIVHWIGSWVGSRASLDILEQYRAFARNESWFLSCPVCCVVGNYCAITAITCYNQAVSLPVIISAVTWTQCLKPEYGSSMFIWNIIANLQHYMLPNSGSCSLNTYCKSWVHSISKNPETTSKFWAPEDDIKHVLYWVP
jgi:hypothetical protein